MPFIHASEVTKIIDGEQYLPLAKDLDGKDIPHDYYITLLIPQDSKWKDRIESLGRLFAQMAVETPLDCPLPDKKVTKLGFPIETAHTLRAIGMFLGYYLNCTQWRENTLEEFDRATLLKRLEHIKQLL